MAEQRKRRVCGAARVYVSINRRGEIAMNAAAFGEIDEPASVTLMYEAKKRRIGVKFPVSADENFFPVRRYGRGRRMRIVRAARLLKQFGIEIERTLIFADAETVMFRGSPMLVLDLRAAESEPGAGATGLRGADELKNPVGMNKNPVATAPGSDRAGYR